MADSKVFGRPTVDEDYLAREAREDLQPCSVIRVLAVGPAPIFNEFQPT
jgi:hypothetical protein